MKSSESMGERVALARRAKPLSMASSRRRRPYEGVRVEGGNEHISKAETSSLCGMEVEEGQTMHCLSNM